MRQVPTMTFANPTLPQKYLFYDDASQILVRLNSLFLVYENEDTPLTQRASHLKIFDTETSSQ